VAAIWGVLECGTHFVCGRFTFLRTSGLQDQQIIIAACMVLACCPRFCLESRRVADDVQFLSPFQSILYSFCCSGIGDDDKKNA